MVITKISRNFFCFNASHGPNMTIMFFFFRDIRVIQNYTLKNYKSSSRYVKFALL